MSFSSTRHVRRTRRASRCTWCREPINPGEPSVVTSGVFCGDFYTRRDHPECYDAIDRYCETYRAWGEELPEGPMVRGGIEEFEPPDEQTLDTFTNTQ